MSTGVAADRVAEANAAAELLGDADAVLRLSVEALGMVCAHGVALVFMRRADGTIGHGAAWADGALVWRGDPRPAGKVPWSVDVDCVPDWQRNRWIEPLRAGVHGPALFSRTNPVMKLISACAPPDYGRMMLCRHGRMVAWMGVYVDGSRGFSNSTRAALVGLSARLAAPLLFAARLAEDVAPRELAPRQRQVLTRVALGATNKRIARELGISPATVKTLLERLFRVSGAANRAALVDWWRAERRPTPPTARRPMEARHHRAL